MAWNGSQGVETPKKVEPKHGPAISKGLLAGLGVVAIAGIAWFFLSNKEEKPVEIKKDVDRPTQIKEVAPAATNKVEKAKSQMTKEEKRLADIKYFRDKYGDNIPDNLKATVYFLEHPGKPVARFSGKFGYLKHSSERQIANLLTKEPGTLYIQKPTLGDRFDKDFQNALVDRVEIAETDSDEVKELKNAVEAAKKELAQACRSTGKLPSELMTEQLASMYELGKYNQELRKEIAAIRDDPSHSDEDYELYVEAANKMLKNKGLKEIAMPNLAYRAARLKMREAQRAKKNATPNGGAN